MVFHLELLKCMVLKTRPDRPIKLSANHGSSSVRSFRPESGRTRIKPVKLVVQPANRINQTIPSKSSSSFYFFLFLHCRRLPLVGPPPRAGKASSRHPLPLEKPSPLAVSHQQNPHPTYPCALEATHPPAKPPTHSLHWKPHPLRDLPEPSSPFCSSLSSLLLDFFFNYFLPHIIIIFTSGCLKLMIFNLN